MNIFFIYNKYIDKNKIFFIQFFDIINIFKKLKYNLFLLTKKNNWNKFKLYNIKNLYFNNIYLYDNLQLLINDINLKYDKKIFINFNENITNFNYIINVPEYNIFKNNSLFNIINNDNNNLYENSFYIPYNKDKILIQNNYLGNPLILSKNFNFINDFSNNINNNHKINLFIENVSNNIISNNFNIIESDLIYELESILTTTPFIITDSLFYLNLSFKYNIPSILFSSIDFDYEYKTNDINKLKFYYHDFYLNRDMCKYIGENTELNFNNNIIKLRDYININNI